jgi:hypothetical protein
LQTQNAGRAQARYRCAILTLIDTPETHATWRPQEWATSTTKFNKTLNAVREPDATQAAIGEALRADIHETDEPARGRAEPAVNVFDECAAVLSEQGYDYDAEYLRRLYGVAATKARERYLRE